jgi:hypothetical protein
MVLISVTAAVGRAYYLDHVGSAHRIIATAPFDALVGPLRAGARLTFAAALAVFLIAWLSESKTLVDRERRARALAVELMQRYARPLAIAGASVAAVVLVAWDRPRPLVVLSTIAAVLAWEVLCLAAGRFGPQGGRGTPTAAD